MKRSFDGEMDYDRSRRHFNGARLSPDRPWQTVRKLVPPAMAFQNLTKSGTSVDTLEKKIESIDAKLEKISNFVRAEYIKYKFLQF